MPAVDEAAACGTDTHDTAPHPRRATLLFAIAIAAAGLAGYVAYVVATAIEALRHAFPPQ
jgi:hypothetical protein